MSRRPSPGSPPKVLERLALEREVGELCQAELDGTGGDMAATAARRALNGIFQEKWEIIQANSLLTRSILLRLGNYLGKKSSNEVANLVMMSAAEMYFVGLVAETLQLLTEGDSRVRLDLSKGRGEGDGRTWNSLPLKRGRVRLGELTVVLDLDRARYEEENRKREEMLKKGRHSYLVAARSDVDPRVLAEGGWACSLAGSSIEEGGDPLILGDIEVNVPIEPIFSKIKFLLSLTR
ncbi:MAG TPA: hypothetical protein VMS77_03610 [Conexivisphaerales archaeon]|nr:hypothetical protein [Conexivisphaerales archaeon]